MEQPPRKDNEPPAMLPVVLRFRWWRIVLADAIGHLNTDDGWAMASHVALSSLMALFPFLIFVGALAGFFGDAALADQIADRLFDAWPADVAAPIASQVHQVLAEPRGGLLTISVLIAVFLASNGLEALRAALNRAYRATEYRSIFVLRAQSITLVVIGAGASLLYGIMGIAAPLLLQWVDGEFPYVSFYDASISNFRLALTGCFVAGMLLAAHVLLPAKRPAIAFLWPGILLTLVLWVIGASLFALYLSTFANYVATYAGLAGIVTAIFFLYLSALIMIFGAEFNAAVDRVRTSSLVIGR